MHGGGIRRFVVYLSNFAATIARVMLNSSHKWLFVVILILVFIVFKKVEALRAGTSFL